MARLATDTRAWIGGVGNDGGRDPRSALRAQAEHSLALSTGVDTLDPDLEDLEHELETWREFYVGSAVTEIATLRGELFGRQTG
jgi:hypothetical protein